MPEKGGGGFTHARIFWPFFHQVKVPKIGTFLLKTNDICMFFCKNYHHYHNHHYNHYYDQWHFFPSYAQNVVFDNRTKRTNVRIEGRGFISTVYFQMYPQSDCKAILDAFDQLFAKFQIAYLSNNFNTLENHWYYIPKLQKSQHSQIH